MRVDRRGRVTAEPDPAPHALDEDLLNRNDGRRYDTPRRYETREPPARNADAETRRPRD